VAEPVSSDSFILATKFNPPSFDSLAALQIKFLFAVPLYGPAMLETI
jgi:hypothetical protein